MRIKRSMLVVALFQLMLVPRAVSAQEESMCFRCMDYNHCGWVDGGNNTSCTEWPCAYTGKPCGEGDGFDWNANRIEVRDENGVLVQMEEVTSTRFAYWNCEKEVLRVADRSEDGSFQFLDPSRFHLEISVAENGGSKAVLVPLNET